MENVKSHFTEEDLLWFYYGEAENATEIDLHVQSCAACRGALEALKRDLAVISSAPVPTPALDYGENVWRSLVRKDAGIAKDRLEDDRGDLTAEFVHPLA